MTEPNRIVVEPAPAGQDSLPRLQAAADQLQGTGEIVLLSTRPYLLSGTWYLPRPAASALGLNISSIGHATLKLLDETAPPPADGLLRVESNWQYKLSGFSVVGTGTRSDDPTTQPRSGIGIWLGREPGHGTSPGTQGSGCILERVYAIGWAVGFRLGTAQGIATSELLFSHCAARICDIGMELLDQNTLNVALVMWSMEANRVGVRVYQPGANDVHVWGGSASNNGVDFHLAPGGVFSVNGFRSEGATQFLVSGQTRASTNIVISSCEVLGMHSGGAAAVHCGWGNSLMVVSSTIQGTIGWQQVFGPGGVPLVVGTLTMIGSCVRGSPGKPFRADASAAGMPYRVLACSYRLPGNPDGVPDGWFPDQVGVVRGADQLVPAWAVGADGVLQLGGSPRVVTGSWADGSAARNLAAVLGEAGFIVDQTTP